LPEVVDRQHAELFLQTFVPDAYARYQALAAHEYTPATADASLALVEEAGKRYDASRRDRHSTADHRDHLLMTYQFAWVTTLDTFRKATDPKARRQILHAWDAAFDCHPLDEALLQRQVAAIECIDHGKEHN
jgi:hypothetical protein